MPASMEVQDVIVTTILAQDHGAGILAEEGPEEAEIPVHAKHLWIIDPICGSLNYVQGIPHFAVSVALRIEGQLCVGVVYNPCTDEMFAASSATPACLNEQRIVVQQMFEGLEAWSGASVGADWPYGAERRAQTKTIVGKMTDQVRQCNLMGSPALGLCNVAAGRLHAYWHLDLRIWDIAAASVILQRAGAMFTDTQGGSWLYSDGGYVASNVVVHDWTVNCIQSALNSS